MATHICMWHDRTSPLLGPPSLGFASGRICQGMWGIFINTSPVEGKLQFSQVQIFTFLMPEVAGDYTAN